MAENMEPERASNSLWGFDGFELSWIKELYLTSIDSFIREKPETTHPMGKIYRTGVNAMPPGLYSYVRELQSKFKCSQARIEIATQCHGLSIVLFNEPKNRIRDLLRVHDHYSSLSKDGENVKAIKYLEKNTGGFDFLDTSEHSTAIAHPELIWGIETSLAGALGIKPIKLVIYLMIVSLETRHDSRWAKIFILNELSHFWSEVEKRKIDVGDLPNK
jgi:hypothetical protein